MRKEVSTASALPGFPARLVLFRIASRAKYLGFPSIVAFCTASSNWWRPCFVWKEDVSVVFSGFSKKGKIELGIFWRPLVRFYGLDALSLFCARWTPLPRCSQVVDNRILLHHVAFCFFLLHLRSWVNGCLTDSTTESRSRKDVERSLWQEIFITRLKSFVTIFCHPVV